ncbi:MAG: RNA polymerase sigma factor [Clostridia bacterium]|nr:RNA polymerase sigma factor [Clostridia bacterium]
MERVQKLYELYRTLIMRYFLRLTGNMEEAKELTQETFFQACLSIHSFHQKSSAKTWLYAIARNVYLKNLRKKSKDKYLPLDEYSWAEGEFSTGDPGEQMVIRETREKIAQALLKLPENARTVIILKEYEQLGYEEIAEICGQTVNWARVTFFRAKKNLLEIYQKLEGDEQV